MACNINYKGKVYSEEDFKIIASTHENIKKSLKAGGLFHQFKDKLYYSKNNVNKINKENERIAKINSVYGNKIVIPIGRDREVTININPIAQTVLETAKLSTTPNEIQGKFLFQKLQENKNKTSPNTILNKKIENFLTKNNIPVQYLDSLKKITGEDANAAYDVINRTILVAQGKEDLDTLPEETGHSIVETLGVNHPLVKTLLFHVSKMDYKTFLGEEYVKTYQNNENLLIREAAGKLIGQAIVTKGGITIIDRVSDIINRLIHSFLNLFTRTSDFETDVQEAKKFAEKTASDLASKVLDEEVFNEKYAGFQDKPVHQFFYQKETAKKGKILNKKEDEVRAKIKYVNKIIDKLKKQIIRETDVSKKEALQDKLDTLSSRFAEYQISPTAATVTEVARPLIYKVEQFISKVETGEIKESEISGEDLLFSFEALSQFSKTGLATEVVQLVGRLDPIINKYIETVINQESTRAEQLTVDDINTQVTDINYFKMGLGALADQSDILAGTIGSLIKKTQNKISRFTEKEANEIDKAVTDLTEYQKTKGLYGEDIYNIFIQDIGNTTVLTRPYTSEFYKDREKAFKDLQSDDTFVRGSKWLNENLLEGQVINKAKYTNKNYEQIQANPKLKEFYSFYQKKTKEAFEKLPINGSIDFIANIRDRDLKDIIKSKGLIKGLKEGISHLVNAQQVRDKARDTELDADEIPLSFVNKIKPEEKSRNLGASLLTFTLFANSHNEMSEILPKTRLLQEKIGEKIFVKSTSPNDTVIGTNTNLYKMAKTVIDMQVKGEMKKDLYQIKFTGTDENGKPKEMFYDLSSLIDIGLKYNSLLRIGFNPFLAVTNVVVGDINNTIEAFGGRFFSAGDLTKASGVFYSQIYTKNSKLNKIHNTVKVLRELEDYAAIDKLKLKKKGLSWDKIQNWAYKPQSRGELFLQSRVMTASMMHDKITDKNGKKHTLWEAFDEKGDWRTDLFGELTEDRIGRMTNRIQRIIEMIHGRYSQQDAGTWTQNAIFRAAFQFKKWIPAAVEARWDKYDWDPRLGEYTEGRWKTGNRLIKELFSKDPDKRTFSDMVGSVFSAKKRLAEGGLTDMEVANIKKNLVELVLITASILLGAKFLDDDELKKNKGLMSNPAIKFSLDQLNRVSGDLMFFLSPNQITNMGSNVVPLAKTLNDLGTTILNVKYAFGGVDATYKKGAHKDENKFVVGLLKLIPGANPLLKIKTNLEKEPYILPKNK